MILNWYSSVIQNYIIIFGVLIILGGRFEWFQLTVSNQNILLKVSLSPESINAKKKSS